MAVPLTKETLEMIEACTGLPLGVRGIAPGGLPNLTEGGTTLDLANVREERRGAIATLMTSQLKQGQPSTPVSPKSCSTIEYSTPWWNTGEQAALGPFAGDAKYESNDSTSVSVEDAFSCGVPSRRPSVQSDWPMFKHKDLCAGLAPDREAADWGAAEGLALPKQMRRSRRNSYTVTTDFHSSPGMGGGQQHPGAPSSFSRSVARRASEGNISMASFARRFSTDSIHSLGMHSWKTDSAWSLAPPYQRVRRNSTHSDLSIPNTDDSFLYMAQRHKDIRSMSPTNSWSGEPYGCDQHGPGTSYLGSSEGVIDSPVMHLPGQLRASIRRESRGSISSPFCAIPEQAAGFAAWNSPPLDGCNNGGQHGDSDDESSESSSEDDAGAHDVGGGGDLCPELKHQQQSGDITLPLSGVALTTDHRTGCLQLHPASHHHSLAQQEQLLKELDMHQRAVQQLKESLWKTTMQTPSSSELSSLSPVSPQRQLPTEQFSQMPRQPQQTPAAAAQRQQHRRQQQHDQQSVQAARTAQLRTPVGMQHGLVPPPGLTTPEVENAPQQQQHPSSRAPSKQMQQPAAASPASPNTRQLRRPPAASKGGGGRHGSKGSQKREVPATTLMLQHLSKGYSRDQLCGLMDSLGLAGSYDFVYIPLKFSTGVSFGYSFVNFVSTKAAQRCEEVMEGFSNWGDGSEEVCTVSRKTTYQGQRACVDLYRNSPVMHESVGDHAKPAIFCNGVRVEFPPPTKRLKPPRARAAQVAEHASEA